MSTSKQNTFFILIMAIVCLCSSSFVSGLSFSDTVSYSASPFYTALQSANTNSTFSLNIPSVNAESKIKNAIITVKGYINPTATIELYVDGQSCNNPSVLISTSYANAGAFSVDYDCSNIIEKPSDYVLTLRSTKAINALYVSADVTTEHTRPEFFVAGTDYQVGDTGKVFTTLSTDGVAVNNASCMVEIFYPDNTLFIANQPMTFLDHGIYYHNFIVPNVTGIYPLYMVCTYRVDDILYNATSVTREIGGGGGVLSNTYVVDGLTYDFDEAGGSGRQIKGVFNYTVSSGGYDNTTAFLDIAVRLVARRTIEGGDPVSDPINVGLFNYVTNQYDFFPSQFSYTTGFQSFYFSTGTNVTNYILNNSFVSLIINDTIIEPGDTKDTDLDIDLLQVEIITYIVDDNIVQIAGGGELNVRDYFRPLNDTLQSQNQYFVSILGNLSSIQTGINQILLTNLSIDYGLIWSYPVRNLTYYPPSSGGGVVGFDFTANSTNVSGSGFIILVNSTQTANYSICLYENSSLLSCEANNTYAYNYETVYNGLSNGTNYALNITLCNVEGLCISKYYEQLSAFGAPLILTGESRIMAINTFTTFSLSFGTVAIILLILCLLVGVFAKQPGVKILCGMMLILLGFVLMGTVGFAFSLIIMALGGVLGVIGWVEVAK